MSDFDPDAYLKQVSGSDSFDADAYLKAHGPPREEKFNAAQSAVMHGLQGATGGFMDELQGLGEAAGRVAGVKGVGGPMKDMGLAKGGPTIDWETLRDAYTAARDHERASLKQQSEDHPIVSGLANLGGMLVSPINKFGGGMSSGGATLAETGAVMGGVNGLGSSDAKDLAGMAKDTALGAGLGYGGGVVAQKAAPYLEKGIEKLSAGAGDAAERFGARALGAERGTIKSLGIDKVKGAARQMLDEGGFSPFASTEDLVERNAALKAKGGGMMGQAYDAIDNAGASTFNPQQAASEVDSQLGDFYRSPINRGETNQFNNTIESILARDNGAGGNIPLRDAQSLKEELGKVANWKNTLNITDKEKMARSAYGIVSKQIDEAMASGASTLDKAGLSETLSAGKGLYSNASTAEKLLENKLAREQGNKMLGITDWSLLGGGLGAAIPTGGASIPATMAMTGAKKYLEKYGPQQAALGLNKTSQLLSKSPAFAALAQRNPQAFNAIVVNFAQKAGPGLSRVASDGRAKPDFVSKPMDDKDAKSSFLEGN